MGPSEALTSLATLCGVEVRYHDIQGRVCAASAPALEAVLSALLDGHVTDDNAASWLARRREPHQGTCLAPVSVLWEGQGSLALWMPPTLGGHATLRVELEGGGCRQLTLDLQDLKRDASGRCKYTLPFRPPMGYHRLTLELHESGISDSAALWSAPQKAYQGADRAGWGVFAPTYALRSARNMGIGDLGDLSTLAGWLGSQGGRMLATLPLLPTFVDNLYDPSPYAPVSRLFWNELYLQLEELPELAQCAQARALLGQESFRATSRALGKTPLVDYPAVQVHKRRVLALLAETAFADSSVRHELLERLERQPELGQYARFRAACEQRERSFRRWPESERAGGLCEGDVQQAGFRYHVYVQVRMADQMAALATRAKQCGVGLYLDLSLGAHRDGFDSWRFQHWMLPGCAAGAPPDALFEGGQNWGFSPPHPWHATSSEHRYFRDSLAHVMQHADVVRIDHVMGLHRLFCVPDGMSATDGVYVRQPAEELLAAVCIESHRHLCCVVGEDLGTVPDEVRAAMRAHGLSRLCVTQYSTRFDGESVPADSVASLNTHDMPKYAAFLRGDDVQVQQKLGLLDEGQADSARRERVRLVSEKQEALRAAGLLDGRDDDGALLDAELTWLGRCPARRALVDLEDLWLERAPQNVPGTGGDWPNWRRRMALTVAELAEDPEVRRRVMLLAQRNLEPVPADTGPTVAASRLTDMDVHLFNEGTHYRLWEKLGAHMGSYEGSKGCFFAVWAPNADHVSVVGDFNGWQGQANQLFARDSSGVWEGFVPGAREGMRYKYRITAKDGRVTDKADPMGQRAEVAPRTASILHGSRYTWRDSDWMAARPARQRRDQPCSMYEVHLGSFCRQKDGRMLSYRELAPLLVDRVRALGFSHVELLPVMEHPFYASWGYQCTGYFAATSRYGAPEDLMFLIDTLHQAGIGVVLDWVPGHFPEDAHGLARFDGTCLYEHEDPRRGFHPDWRSLIFNFGRNEVKSFLVSSALYWLEVFHADGLRVDGVASMLYLDYSRKPGEWLPNEHGGRENLSAIELLQQLNEAVYGAHPDCQTTAEESTAWPMVSRPSYLGGLGFGYKWDMGWMHDTLSYFSRDPVHRKFHHHQLTFRSVYAYNENFVLPLSHDEVVHGKGSLLAKMVGDEWQRFANLRALYAYMFAVPGHKLLFMGSELAGMREWNHDVSLDWQAGETPHCRGVARLLGELNRLYRGEAALHALDFEPEGFRWVDTNNAEQSVLAFERRDNQGQVILAAFNFTPIPRLDYRIGVESPGCWRELLNTDASEFGGSGLGNLGGVVSEPREAHGRPHSVCLTLPPLSALYLEHRTV